MGKKGFVMPPLARGFDGKQYVARPSTAGTATAYVDLSAVPFDLDGPIVLDEEAPQKVNLPKLYGTKTPRSDSVVSRRRMAIHRATGVWTQ